jgi:hypothetical protein
MSFSVGTYTFSLRNGETAVSKGYKLKHFLLSPQVYSTNLSIVAPSLE